MRQEFFQCLRCTYKWKGRSDRKSDIPKQCARCKNRYWNEKKTKNTGFQPKAAVEEVIPQVTTEAV